ncbi:3-oxoacyl-[acyl-carrier-protein] synthase 2 [Abditibacteriota bacterium]|nr:3-oxoacyl-[acyl-carrier-protein] synthase 2 [Abditibacteriota bacterium]
MERVVVTGLGAVTPIGIGTSAFWNGVVEARNGIKPITLIDAAPHIVKFAGEITEFDPHQYIEKREAKRMDRFVQLAIVASDEALANSGLQITEENQDRVGVIIGCGVGGLQTWETEHTKFMKGGPDRVSPFLIPMMIVNMAAGHVSIRTGARGPNTSVVSACTSSAHAIGVAFDFIQRGEADAMITGGTEAPISNCGVAGFGNMRALSRRNDDYKTASRPFDKDRDGFVMGEGAGTLILESLTSAKARGAHIYAEMLGHGWAGDAYHMTGMREDGSGYAKAIGLALKKSGITADEVDYVNAHGTSTPTNDPVETRALKDVFGERAHKVPVSSTKSQIGHLLGGGSAVESIACIKALEEGILPPTINHFEPDPDCDLDYVPNASRRADINVALNNATGFGGHYAAILFRKWSE